MQPFLTLRNSRKSSTFSSSPGQTVTRIAGAFFSPFNVKSVVCRMQASPLWKTSAYRDKFWQEVHAVFTRARQYVPECMWDLMDTGCGYIQARENCTDESLACWYVLARGIERLCASLAGRPLCDTGLIRYEVNQGVSGELTSANEAITYLKQGKLLTSPDTKELDWFDELLSEFNLPSPNISAVIARFIEKTWEQKGEERRVAGIQLHAMLNHAITTGDIRLTQEGKIFWRKQIADFWDSFRSILGVSAAIASELPVVSSSVSREHSTIRGRVDVIFLSCNQPDPGTLHVVIGDFKHSSPENMKKHGEPGFGPCEGMVSTSHTKGTIALWIYAHLLETYSGEVFLGKTRYDRIVVDRLVFIYFPPSDDQTLSEPFSIEEVPRDPSRLAKILQAV